MRASKLCVLLVDHAWLVVKLTVLAFSFAFGQMASAEDWYVATNGTGTGTNGWANATNSLQGAIDAIGANITNTVWVSNGVYETGGMTNYPSGSILTNRVVIWKSMTVRSLNNDPTNTIIKGAWASSGQTNALDSVRCLYMANSTKLIGFTLTNGATTASYVSGSMNTYGAGVCAPAVSGEPTAIISNCIIVGNSAWWSGTAYGGGVCYCKVYNSLIMGNVAGQGGGAAGSTLINCQIISNRVRSMGGGVASTSWRPVILSNCTVRGNAVTIGSGGGAGDYDGTKVQLYNCLIISNSASSSGGGVNGTNNFLYNCTIVSNSAGSSGGGIGCSMTTTLYNCISWGNSKTDSGPFTAYSSCGVGYSGNNNITNDPNFVGGNNYRLAANSPCINAGTNGSWTTNNALDLDGKPRIRYGTVDMGAYERISGGTIFSVH